MKKLIILSLLLLLSGCGVLQRGNYSENSNGYVIDNNLVVNYHTNETGHIDMIVIDQTYSFLEALESVSSLITLNDLSVVGEEDLIMCNIDVTLIVPKFIRVNDDHYYFKVNDTNSCSYDAYVLDEDDYIIDSGVSFFHTIDFSINPFDMIIYVEEVHYLTESSEYVRYINSVVPMSIRQEGNLSENHDVIINEYDVISNYLIENQSINLLELREDYLDENVSNIWSDFTIDSLGRDSEIVKNVRDKNTEAVLMIIKDTLARLGMFS